MEWLRKAVARRFMGYYLRFLAVVMALSSLVHFGNMAGLGEKPWLETPLAWRIGDVVYGVVDLLAAILLWLKSPWGVLLALAAVASQFVIYTAFIDSFASTEAERAAIHGLLQTEAVLVAGFLIVLWSKK